VERGDAGADGVDVRQELADALGRHRGAPVAVGREQVLDGVGQLGDARLAHDARRALERVGQAQQVARDLGAAAALLPVQPAAAQLVDELAGLDAEEPVWILRAHALAGGRMSRVSSRDSPVSWVAVASVCPALASVSRVALATLAMATLTCSTAVDCCLV